MSDTIPKSMFDDFDEDLPEDPVLLANAQGFKGVRDKLEATLEEACKLNPDEDEGCIMCSG